LPNPVLPSSLPITTNPQEAKCLNNALYFLGKTPVPFNTTTTGYSLLLFFNSSG